MGSIVKNIPGFENGFCTRLAVVQNIWRGVENAAKAMAAEICDHRHAVALGEGLDGVADVTKSVAGFNHLDALHQRLVRDVDQALGLAGQFARDIHPRSIAKPTIHNHGHIDIDDVAVFSFLSPGMP